MQQSKILSQQNKKDTNTWLSCSETDAVTV